MSRSRLHGARSVAALLGIGLVLVAGCHLSDPIRDRFPEDGTDLETGGTDTSADGNNEEERDGVSGEDAVDTSPVRDTASDDGRTLDGGADAPLDTDDGVDGHGDARDTRGETDVSDGDTQQSGLDSGGDTDAGATCDDGVQNGDESDVDCGGSNCGGCTAGDQCRTNSDCRSGWCRDGSCHVRIEGQLTLGRAGRWSNGTVADSCDAYRHPTQSNYAYTSASGEPGDGIYLIAPDPSKSSFVAYCEMDRAGGGWTLAVVSADDGQTTWTWDRRTLWTTDTSRFGSPANRTSDFKSRAMHELPVADLLFVHRPTDEWLSYTGIGSGGKSVAEVIADKGETCYADSSSSSNVQPGHPKSDGTVTASGDLCSTDLYFNPKDQDGSGACGDDDHAFGPAWSANEDGAGCPLDDPGEGASLGPNFEKPSKEEDPRGFAQPIGQNSSGDALLMYVR